MAKKDKRDGGMAAVVEVKVSEMPEVLAALRRELAGLLRAEADRSWEGGERNAVDMAVCQSLRKVADVFEAGLQSPEDIG